MENRLKFRVRDIPYKKYINFIDMAFLKRGISILDRQTGRNYFYDFSKPKEDQDIAIEQCTGLKDKNGTLIYCGDMLKISQVIDGKVIASDKANVMVEEYGRFELDRCLNSFKTIGGHDMYFFFEDGYDNKAFEVEIIGNIHENPELKNKEGL